MILDQQSLTADETILDTPDWTFGTFPAKTTSIIETNNITASNSPTTQSVTAAADQPE